MSADICQDGLFARIERQGDEICIQLLSGHEPERLIAELTCKASHLKVLLSGYSLQLSNKEGDYFQAASHEDGIHVTFVAADVSRSCVVPKEIFTKALDV